MSQQNISKSRESERVYPKTGVTFEKYSQGNSNIVYARLLGKWRGEQVVDAMEQARNEGVINVDTSIFIVDLTNEEFEPRRVVDVRNLLKTIPYFKDKDIRVILPKSSVSGIVMKLVGKQWDNVRDFLSLGEAIAAEPPLPPLEG